jgi:hypothetical protein
VNAYISVGISLGKVPVYGSEQGPFLLSFRLKNSNLTPPKNIFKKIYQILRPKRKPDSP